MSATSEPPRQLKVTIPQYQVMTTADGMDHVEIPGGFELLVPGKPLVPLYDASVECPEGCRVREVTLKSRSGLSTTTGLSIPSFEPAVAGEPDEQSALRQEGNGWWPERDIDWSVEEHPDGTSTLSIRMYPFYYHATTTNVRFYTDYDLEISYVTSTVEIVSLATHQDAYPQGSPVEAALWLQNTGEPTDVLIEATIKKGSTDEIAKGLPLHSLKSLNGLASFSYQWDSGDHAAGDYYLEVQVRNTDGDTLAWGRADYRLGVPAGQIALLEATPTVFEVGDTVDISLVFSNTGTVPITGTVAIEVQQEGISVVQSWRGSVDGLPSGESLVVEKAWDTSAALGGDYRIVGWVWYDGRAAGPVTTTVTTSPPAYYLHIPAILKETD